MSSTPPIGQIIGPNEQRDAIHVAIAPVVAVERLNPGEHIGLLDGKASKWCEKPIGIVDPFLAKPVNAGERFFMFLYPQTITSLRHDWTHPAFEQKSPTLTFRRGSDGFLVISSAGEQFDDGNYGSSIELFTALTAWLTGKTADPAKWIAEHCPEVADAATAAALDNSAGVLREFADELGLSLNELKAAANDWIDHEDYYVESGSEHMRNTMSGRWDEFWKHYERHTGRKVDPDKKHGFFSCSC